MGTCEICGAPGEKHHIVFRSQGGMNFDRNFASLCINHHKFGPEAVHNNRELDLRLKVRMQRGLEELFAGQRYSADEVCDMLNVRSRTERTKLKKRLLKGCGLMGYLEREDIIKTLMGGKLYG